MLAVLREWCGFPPPSDNGSDTLSRGIGGDGAQSAGGASSGNLPRPPQMGRAGSPTGGDRFVVACMQCSGQFARAAGEPPVTSCRICGSSFVVETREQAPAHALSGAGSSTVRPSALDSRITIDGYSSSPVRPSPIGRASAGGSAKMMLVSPDARRGRAAGGDGSSGGGGDDGGGGGGGGDGTARVAPVRVDPISLMPSYLVSTSMARFLRACGVLGDGEEPLCSFQLGCARAHVDGSSSSSSSSSSGGAVSAAAPSTSPSTAATTYGLETPVALIATERCVYILDYASLKNAYRSVSVNGLVIGRWAYATDTGPDTDGGARRQQRQQQQQQHPFTVRIGMSFQWFRLEMRAGGAQSCTDAYVFYVRDRDRACGVLERLSSALQAAVTVESLDSRCAELVSARLGLAAEGRCGVLVLWVFFFLNVYSMFFF
jgi:hypothetical protein